MATTPTAATSAPPPASTSPTPSPSNPPRRDAFRERVDARKRDNPGSREGSRRSGKGDPQGSNGLPAHGDGALWISSGPLPPSAWSGRALAPKPAPQPPREAPGRTAVALTDVRVGGAPGAAQVHARIAEGRHAGVEVRAVERNGRVAIELVAPSGASERALRAEMSDVREVLAARGMDGVSVDVRSGDEERRERQRQAAEESAENTVPGETSGAARAIDPTTTSDGDVIL